MKTLCEINDLIERGSLGNEMKEITKPQSFKTLEQGNYYAPQGMITDAPNSKDDFVFHVYTQKAASETMIQAIDTKTGHQFFISRNNNAWLSKWVEGGGSVDWASNTEKGAITYKVSGTTLYVSNTGAV